MQLKLSSLKKDLRSQASKEKAKILQRFFKTGPGEYGEGDVFLGVTVPKVRSVARQYLKLPFSDVKKLLQSKVHEERLCALLILVEKFGQADAKEQKQLYGFYLLNTKYINNWDLVDLSADKIVGTYLMDKPKSILTKLAHSKNMWERRIAIIATFRFIKNNQFNKTLKIAKLLLYDEHDLLHKAVGWMLREVGKRSLETEEVFLRKYYKNMPRTMLRYAIERFQEKKRQAYLKGRI